MRFSPKNKEQIPTSIVVTADTVPLGRRTLQRLSATMRFASRPTHLTLFLLFFLSFAQFVTGLNSVNTISRIGLTANMSQYGRIDIGGYDARTIDKASYNGEYYSDKAPSMSFLALPAAYIYTRLFSVSPDFSGDHAYRRFAILVYVCILSTSVPLAALAAVLLFSLVKRLTESNGAALVAALAYALATPTWGWAASFFGHATAGALLFIGFALVETLAQTEADRRKRLVHIITAGAALGVAVSVEFTSAIAVAIILGYCVLLTSVQRGWSAAWISCIAIAAVAALMQIPLLCYNAAAFGSPLHLGYANVVGFDGMKTGFFGIGVPKPDVIAQLFVGPRRGVLWLSPVLIPAAMALVAGFRRKEYRLRSAAIAAVTGYYVLLNSGYAYWDGGWSTGPRHITPVYPFLALALGTWFATTGRRWRIATLILLTVSILINLACVAVSMTTPAEVPRPLFDLILPSFIAGDLPQAVTQIIFGTQGLWQLVPLIAVWLGLGAILFRQFSAVDHASGPAPALAGSASALAPRSRA
jgi:hypothetical protein